MSTTEIQEAPKLPVEQQQYAVDWWNPKGLDEASALAARMAGSSLVPKDYRGKPDDILVAWSLGAPLKLSLLSSLQNIAVVNGRPSIWGDAALAVCRNSPACAYVREWIEGEGNDMVAHCEAMRHGDPEPVHGQFSVQDAKTAGLWGRNTWANYPKRMLQMRARGFALRDAFPDALCGMPITEEVRDITPEVVVRDAEPAPRERQTATERLKGKLRPAEPAPAPEPTATEPADADADADDHRTDLLFRFEACIRAKAANDPEKGAQIRAEIVESVGEDPEDMDVGELGKLVSTMESKATGRSK